MTPAVAERVAVGAAMASGCDPCFRFRHEAARRLGISREDLRQAADVALAVQATPHRKVRETADRLLAPSLEAPSAPEDGERDAGGERNAGLKPSQGCACGSVC